MSAANITPASFGEPSGSASTSTTSRPTTTQPQNPEYVEKQQKDTVDIFDTPPDVDLTGEGEGADDEPQNPTATPAVVPPTEPTTPTTPPGGGFDVSTLSTAMVESLKAAGFMPQQQQQQAKQDLSPEEFNKLTNHFDVTPELLEQLDSPDPAVRVQNYNAFVDGIRKNVVTLAYHLMQQSEQRLLGQVQPALSAIEHQKSQELTQTFHTKFPSLADPKFKPILAAAVQEVKTSGQRFASQEAALQAIADRATQTIQAVNPAFQLAASTTTPTKQKQTTMPAPNGSPSGGGGGAGNKTRTKVPVTTGSGTEVFD